jgi:lysophospholipase L1-like esterase
MAEYIANRSDWDFATLEMGINVIGDIEVGEFAQRVRTFVATIARRHPEQWIACIDLFTCDRDIAKDRKIAAFRTVVREVVRQLDLPRLIHIPGTVLLTSVQGLTTDLVHPSAAGMEEIAHNLIRVLDNHIARAVA